MNLIFKRIPRRKSSGLGVLRRPFERRADEVMVLLKARMPGRTRLIFELDYSSALFWLVA